MQLTWWGAAAVCLQCGDDVFWFDPFLARAPRARPGPRPLPAEQDRATAIFLTHGHFDHALGVADLANRWRAPVFCHAVAGRTLIRDGLDPALLRPIDHDGQRESLGPVSVLSRHSGHVRFDAALVLRTLPRILPGLTALGRLMAAYPQGQTLCYHIDIAGKSLLLFGSAGAGPGLLAELARQPVDLLLMPLQGHSRICQIGLEYVAALRPRAVMAIHHDDFHPPMSMAVDIGPFVAGLRRGFPHVRPIEAQVGQAVAP